MADCSSFCLVIIILMWESVPHIKLCLIHEKLILNLHCATSWQLWNIPIGHLEIAGGSYLRV